MKTLRIQQSGIIVNYRLDIKAYVAGWDFTTSEQFKITEWSKDIGKKNLEKLVKLLAGLYGVTGVNGYGKPVHND